MPSPWVYDSNAHRFRDTRTGRLISQQQAVRLRDEFARAMRFERAGQLAGRLASGDMTVQAFTLAARQEIKAAYLAEYMLGKGGRHNMNQADFGRVGGLLRSQYGYLQNFANEIKAGNLSEAQVQWRLGLYMDSAGQAYERANAADRQIPEMPAYPKDGSSECKANDQCWWRYEETELEWLCTWTLTDAEHCNTCLDRADRWAPLHIAKREAA